MGSVFLESLKLEKNSRRRGMSVNRHVQRIISIACGWFYGLVLSVFVTMRLSRDSSNIAHCIVWQLALFLMLDQMRQKTD